MAKGPGPALALAAGAALFLMTRKKDKADVVLPGESTDTQDDVGGGPAGGDGGGGGGGSGGDGGGGGGGGGGGHPANLSGYDEGYNTTLIQNSANVRELLQFLGYSVALNNNPLVGDAHVKQFQEHYNKASDENKFSANGTLAVDGTAGAHTLNAMEIVVSRGTPNAGITDPDVGVEWSDAYL